MWWNSKTQILMKVKTKIVMKKKLILWWNSKIKLWLNSKTQIVNTLKSSNRDKTQKLKWLQNSKMQIGTKLKKLKLGQDSKTQIVTQLKLWKIQIGTKLRLWQNSQTQSVTQLKLWQKSKPRFWQNSKTQIWINLKNCNCDKTWTLKNMNLWRFVKGSFSRIILTPWQPMRRTLGSVFGSQDVFFKSVLNLSLPILDLVVWLTLISWLKILMAINNFCWLGGYQSRPLLIDVSK